MKFLAILLLVTIVTGEVAVKSNDTNGTSIDDGVDKDYVRNVTNDQQPATDETNRLWMLSTPVAKALPTNDIKKSDANDTDEASNGTSSSASSSPNDHLNSSSRHWHHYVFGLSFTFFGAASFYTLTHNLVCLAASQRGHLTFSNVLLGVACILRSVYLLDSRNTQQQQQQLQQHVSDLKSVAYNVLVYESPTSLLVSSMMFYVGGLGTYTQAQWSKSRSCTAMLAVNLLATPYLITCSSIVAVAIVLQERIDESTRWSLSLLLKLSSLLWSIVFAAMTFALFKDIRKASLRKQSQIIRATLTKLHIDGTQLPKKLPKPCLGLAAKSIAVTSVLALVTCVVLLFGVALKCDDSFVFKMAAVFDSKSQARVKATWIYYHVIRFCEVAMCCSLTCGLFWSQCGHQCRRRALGDVTIATFWSGLRKRSVWYVAPSSSLGGRRRHSSSDDGNHRHGIFGASTGGSDHVTGSSHAVSRTNFTFERWERSRMPPMNQVPVVDAHFPNVQPILRTFQHRNLNSHRHHHHHNHYQVNSINHRISPQHRLQSHLRSSTMALQRTGRTVSTTVVAGLRSLARSRRSSSSSISSGSSLRPSPARLPSSDGDDERKRARHCNKRICCCGRCAIGEKRVVPTKHAKCHVAPAVSTCHVTHVNKPSIRRKHRHPNVLRDADANKVLMVSRATQVYIPSPQKCTEDDVPEDESRSSKRVFAQWSSVSAGGRADRESSTSCSSESAANSFDVRFYMHGTTGSPRDTSANEGSSSPSHYFHERFYGGQRLIKAFQRFGRDSLEEMSCSSHDMVTVCHKSLPKFQSASSDVITRVVGRQEEHTGEGARGLPSGDCSVLDLTLPLDKGCCCAVAASNNQQDITPDSAVYLELNSPEDRTKLDLPRAWCPTKPVVKLPRSISLTDLHNERTVEVETTADGSRRISARVTSTTLPSVEIAVRSKMSSVSRTMLFKSNDLKSKDNFEDRVVITSLDSLYDSGDDVVSGGSNCNREFLHQGIR